MQKTALIIGSGLGGLGTACLLAKSGYEVTVLEKNDQIGGRAGTFKANGFTFDTGPSWYLMPDVFEHFFELMGESVSDYLQLIKLNPSYRVFYSGLGQQVDIFGDIAKDGQTYESIEQGSKAQLVKYLRRSEYVYHASIERFLYKNYDSWRDFLAPELIRASRKLSILSNMDSYVSRYFKDTRLQQIMQYPLVFLGSSPYNAPALYNLMSHVDFNQGVFYPDGGIYKLIEAVISIAKKNGVRFQCNTPVEKIIVEYNKAVGVVTSTGELRADIVISNADIHHTETQLLEPQQRDYSEAYWKSRTLAPSALLLYLGVKGNLPSLTHHNLLFSKNWKQNFDEIFGTAQFPSDPSLYVCNPNKTDVSVAPPGHENLFVLVPLAAGLKYTDTQLKKYTEQILQLMEKEMNIPHLRENIVYQKVFCVNDFAQKFNSLGGTGLGLAHTLKQTALFRPSNISKKVKNLYYVGANVHPGIGLPVTLISAELIIKRLKGDKTAGALKPTDLAL